MKSSPDRIPNNDQAGTYRQVVEHRLTRGVESTGSHGSDSNKCWEEMDEREAASGAELAGERTDNSILVDGVHTAYGAREGDEYGRDALITRSKPAGPIALPESGASKELLIDKGFLYRIAPANCHSVHDKLLIVSAQFWKQILF